MNNDELIFAEEENIEQKNEQESWKILISDDEKDVHTVTMMVLQDLEFDNKKLFFLNAYTGEETKQLLRENPDTALILLDVVMEEDDTGLKIVKFIREEIKNKFLRIILRTGQPGKAPEKNIITDYDINDYKEKSELTYQKLFTAIIASLRSYQDLRTIERSRQGLDQIVKSSSSLFVLHSLKYLARGVLTQLTSLLGFDENSFYLHSSGFAITQKKGEMYIIAATGEYEEFSNQKLDNKLPEDVMNVINEAINNKTTIIKDNLFVGYFATKNDSINILYLRGRKKITDVDKELLEIFSTNISIAFDNIYLNREMEETQKELIFTLGEVVESRSHEIGNHVTRVAAYSEILARKLGIPEKEIDLLKLASPMHDVGKIGIPDSVLYKPAKLSKEEFNIIKSHSKIGYDILKSSKRTILRAAAVIALQHHERWDGNGYPNGLKEEEIHIFARITCLVDVFDALLHKRIYKEKWELDKVIEFIKGQSGIRFDPKIVKIFTENIDEFIEVTKKYLD